MAGALYAAYQQNHLRRYHPQVIRRGGNTMPVTITSKDVGRKWTYDGCQVFRVMHLKGGTIGMGKKLRRMTVKRLEQLLECGRAVWGDWTTVDSIIRSSGGSVSGEVNKGV
jgi:hypothetical protein